MRLILRGSFGLTFYLILIVMPLVVGSIFRPAGASDFLLVNFAAGLGYVGFALMALELALLSRIEGATRAFGLDALQMFHKQIGLVALVLVLAHPLALIAAGYPWRMLLPWPGVPWAIGLGTLALLALGLLIVLSVWRKRLRLTYEVWQLTHGILAIVLLALAAVHIVGVGRYAQVTPMRVVVGLYLALLIVLYLYYRFYKPLRAMQRPWRVVENRAELGDARTLRLEPEGHAGWGFEPGQFAWINVGRSPFHFEQHPISMSSCGDTAAATGEIAFTIKNLGDWSGTKVAALQEGDAVWLDGPHGVFTLDREQGPGYALIAGGVGITPFHAMLATMAEREDMRPVILFYGGKTLDDLTLREQVLGFGPRLNLQVVLVVGQPAADWVGETGRINAEVLQKYLPPKQYRRWQYFICGPTPMIEAMEEILPEIGVPIDHIHAERFDMV